MNIKPKSYCQFCKKKCKVENGGHYFCPNGHFIVTQLTKITEPIIEVIQPRSIGNIEGENIYKNANGDFCDDAGGVLTEPVSEVNKDESLKEPEVV